MSCITNEQRVALKRVLAGYDELIYRFDDLDTNDFWNEYYDADDEANGVYIGYVGSDADSDGSLFVAWWIDKAIEAANICETILDKEDE